MFTLQQTVAQKGKTQNPRNDDDVKAEVEEMKTMKKTINKKMDSEEENLQHSSALRHIVNDMS